MVLNTIKSSKIKYVDVFVPSMNELFLRSINFFLSKPLIVLNFKG